MRVLSRQFNQLYIVLFLHQTTTVTLAPSSSFGCISYYSYIKPQPNGWCSAVHGVVYRTIPTSNHNTSACVLPMRFVVYRTIPTSNHNPPRPRTLSLWLYIVLFLHQTTTTEAFHEKHARCISYYSYIKPQLYGVGDMIASVVYRTIPTSNHNLTGILIYIAPLYIF